MISKLIKGFDGKYSINTAGVVHSLYRWNNGIKVYSKVEIKRGLSYPARDTGKESLVVNLRPSFGKAKKYTVKKLMWDTFHDVDVTSNSISYLDGDRENLALDNLFIHDRNQDRLKRVQKYRSRPMSKLNAVMREKIKRDELSDDYVKSRIMKFMKSGISSINFNRSDITPSMVSMYRRQLINKRAIRMLKRSAP